MTCQALNCWFALTPRGRPTGLLMLNLGVFNNCHILFDSADRPMSAFPPGLPAGDVPSSELADVEVRHEPALDCSDRGMQWCAVCTCSCLLGARTACVQ
jgi:hypothetical protein